MVSSGIGPYSDIEAMFVKSPSSQYSEPIMKNKKPRVLFEEEFKGNSEISEITPKQVAYESSLTKIKMKRKGKLVKKDKLDVIKSSQSKKIKKETKQKVKKEVIKSQMASKNN